MEDTLDPSSRVSDPNKAKELWSSDTCCSTEGMETHMYNSMTVCLYICNVNCPALTLKSAP